jgi:hypothetical protein
MTFADTVRRLLIDAPGEALCDGCLALACAVSLTEMRHITNSLLAHPTFRRGTACASCQRNVPTIVYPASCPHCGRPIVAGAAACCSYAAIGHDSETPDS